MDQQAPEFDVCVRNILTEIPDSDPDLKIQNPRFEGVLVCFVLRSKAVCLALI